MRILIGLQYYYPYRSGLTEYARMLGEALVRRGHRVTVLTSRSLPELKEEEEIGGVRVLRLPVLFKLNRACFMPRFLPMLARLGKEHDMVNLHFPMPECFPATFLTRKSPLVVTYHCDITVQGSPFSHFLQAVYFAALHQSLRYPHKIVALSREYAEVSAIRPFLEKVVPIFPPIKPLSWKDPSEFKSRLGITGGPVIGFLGRVVFEKGLGDLVAAMPFIKKVYPGGALLIGGETEKVAGGTVTTELKKAALKEKVHIHFTGFIHEDQLEGFYSACDVFVLPSVDRLEAFGMVQVEAMLCGVPVVSVDRPGVRVPIQQTRMGRLVPPRDPEALAEGILGVLRNRNQYLIDRARILERFGESKTVDAYESLFRKLKSP